MLKQPSQTNIGFDRDKQPGLSKKRFLSKKQLYMLFIEKNRFLYFMFFYFSATHRT